MLFSFLLGLALNAGALYLLIYLVPDIAYTGGIWFFVVGGVILGLINAIVRPVIKILSFPLVFLTGGIILIAINMLFLFLLSHGLEIVDFQNVSLTFPNFVTYAIGSVVFGLINWALNLVK